MHSREQLDSRLISGSWEVGTGFPDGCPMPLPTLAAFYNPPSLLLTSGASMSCSAIYSSLVLDPDYAELVSEFVAQVPNRVAAIRTAYNEHKTNQLCTLVHQLRGACGSYGFHDLTPIATSLENGLRSGKPLDELACELETFLSQCLKMTDKSRPAQHA